MFQRLMTVIAVLIRLQTPSQKLLYPLFGNLDIAVEEGSDQWKNNFALSMEDMWERVYRTDEARVKFMETMHNSSRYPCHGVARSFDLSKFRHCDFKVSYQSKIVTRYK